MVDFLAQIGAENVTAKFESVIMWGFISNLVYLLFQIFKMNLTRRGKHGVDTSMVFAEVLVAAMWITQFSYVISYRFSHTGYVCSGDYAEDQLIRSINMNGKVVPSTLDKYNQYYISALLQFKKLKVQQSPMKRLIIIKLTNIEKC